MYYAAKLLIKDPKVYVADYGAAYFWKNIFMDADETLLAQKITVIFKNLITHYNRIIENSAKMNLTLKRPLHRKLRISDAKSAKK